jgi:hypothetical protein
MQLLGDLLKDKSYLSNLSGTTVCLWKNSIPITPSHYWSILSTFVLRLDIGMSKALNDAPNCSLISKYYFKDHYVFIRNLLLKVMKYQQKKNSAE